MEVLIPPSPNWYGCHLTDYAPDQQLWALAAHNSVALLDARDGRVARVLGGHAARAACVAFVPAPGGGLGVLSGGADRSLRLWAVGPGPAFRARGARTLTKRPAEPCAAAAAGRGAAAAALVGDRAGGLFAWATAEEGAKPRRLAACRLPGAALALAAGPAGGAAERLAAAGCAGGAVAVVDWRAPDGAVVARLAPHAGDVHALRWVALPRAPRGAGAEAEEAGGADESLLVSSGADAVIRVHRITASAAGGGAAVSVDLVCTLALPPPAGALSDAQRGRLWAPAAAVAPAAPGAPAWVVAAGYGGALAAWEVPPRGGGGGAPPPPAERLPGGHARAAFSVLAAAVPAGGPAAGDGADAPPAAAAPAAAPAAAHLLLLTTSMDRAAAAWRVPVAPAGGGGGAPRPRWRDARQQWAVAGLGGHAYGLAARAGAGAAPGGAPAPPPQLAVACGDRTIRVVSAAPRGAAAAAAAAPPRLLWQGVGDKATAVAWHPGGEALAFGCADGTVGLAAPRSERAAAAAVRHAGGVLRLAWVAEPRGGGGGSGGGRLWLVSFSADGGLLAWGPWPAAAAAEAEVLPPRTPGGAGTAGGGGGLLAEPADLAAALRLGRLTAFDAAGGVAAVGTAAGGVHLFSMPASGEGLAAWPLGLGSLGGGGSVPAVTHLRLGCLEEPASPRAAGVVVAVAREDGSLGASRAPAPDQAPDAAHGALGEACWDLQLTLPAPAAALAVAPLRHGCGVVTAAALPSGAIVVHRAGDAGPPPPPLELRGHSGLVCALCFEPGGDGDGMLLSGGEDQTVRRWDLAACRLRQEEAAAEAAAAAAVKEGAAAALAEQPNAAEVAIDAAKELPLLPKAPGWSSAAAPDEPPPPPPGSPPPEAAGPKASPPAAPAAPAERGKPWAGMGSKSVLPPALHGEGSPPTDPAAAAAALEAAAAEAAAAAAAAPSPAARRAAAQRSAALSLWAGDAGAALRTLSAHDALSADFVAAAAAAGRGAAAAAARLLAHRLRERGEPQLAALHLLGAGDAAGAAAALRAAGLPRDADALAAARAMLPAAAGCGAPEAAAGAAAPAPPAPPGAARVRYSAGALLRARGGAAPLAQALAETLAEHGLLRGDEVGAALPSSA